MRRFDRRRVWTTAIACSLVLLAVVVAAVILIFNQRSEESGGAVSSAGRNVLAETSPESISTALAQLNWADITLTAEAAATDSSLLERTLQEAGRSTNAPARYLAGLLHLARGEAKPALHAFGSIPPEFLPSEYLYAPDRLYRELCPDSPSPYRSFLIKAMAERRLPALIEARVRAQQGEFREALELYLRCDPAQWANQDVILLSAMMQHAGVGTEVARTVRGALRAGRLSPDVRTNLTQALASLEEGRISPELATSLSEYIKRDSVIQAAAVKAVTNQFEVRRTFVSHRYRELLSQFQDTDPLSLPDETVLFLVLSAARVSDSSSFERWSQEIKRRTPTPQVAQWIRQIKADMR